MVYLPDEIILLIIEFGAIIPWINPSKLIERIRLYSKRDMYKICRRCNINCKYNVCKVISCRNYNNFVNERTKYKVIADGATLYDQDAINAMSEMYLHEMFRLNSMSAISLYDIDLRSIISSYKTSNYLLQSTKFISEIDVICKYSMYTGVIPYLCHDILCINDIDDINVLCNILHNTLMGICPIKCKIASILYNFPIIVTLYHRCLKINGQEMLLKIIIALLDIDEYKIIDSSYNYVYLSFNNSRPEEVLRWIIVYDTIFNCNVLGYNTQLVNRNFSL